MAFSERRSVYLSSAFNTEMKSPSSTANEISSEFPLIVLQDNLNGSVIGEETTEMCPLVLCEALTLKMAPCHKSHAVEKFYDNSATVGRGCTAHT
ncbi:hypothetical protein C0J45_12433 [Silurus meridionalis]|nr:hypothetical protein C0J45_12433 [Silurus meridionalis]